MEIADLRLLRLGRPRMTLYDEGVSTTTKVDNCDACLVTFDQDKKFDCSKKVRARSVKPYQWGGHVMKPISSEVELVIGRGEHHVDRALRIDQDSGDLLVGDDYGDYKGVVVWEAHLIEVG